MPKGTTSSGALAPINNCYLVIPNAMTITLDNLPEIGDSKNAQYNAEPIIGRSSPIHTYHYSDTRNISFTIHLFIQQQGDAVLNLQKLRAIQSALYPREGGNGAPFIPPVICNIRCGDLLAVGQDLCVILQSCNVRFPTDVAYDADTMCPYRFDIETSWWVVYNSPDLPYQDRIITSGR